MTANFQPIYTLTPDIVVGQTILTANTAVDGTGTVVTCFTAGANGSLLKGIVFRALGTNVATVARIFINNGSTNTTASNNILFGEITLSATTLSQTAALATYEWVPPPNFTLPAGYKANITIGTTVAAGYAVSGYGGDY
jgi:hypothetical protein